MNSVNEQTSLFSDSEKIRELIFTHSDVVIYRYDYNKKYYDYMSPSILNLTGYTKDEINEIGFKEIIKK